MPRFFFHLVDSEHRLTDRKGSEFESPEAARRAAEAAARNRMVEVMLQGSDPDGRRYEITDADGRLVATVSFRDALPPTMKA